MSETNSLEDSYPPSFRKHQVKTEPGLERTRTGDSCPDPDPIPVVDLQYVDSDELREVCADWGLFRLVNHGVCLGQLEEDAKKLFSLPFEAKQALFLDSPVSYFWGSPALTPSGTVLSTREVNWVEGFNVPVSQLPLFLAHNPTLPFFRHLQEYSEHLASIATTLFEAMTKDLKIVDSERSTSSYVSKRSGLIRVYRYPPCPNVGDLEALGMDLHTDSSVLSILSQDHVGGLEVLIKGDELVNVRPVPNTLVVNLGDMMQAMTDDAYKSVEHRVKVSKHEERVSICYFIFPEEEFVIRSSKYRPFCYNDFRAQVQRDIKAVGAKVGLDRFKVTS